MVTTAAARSLKVNLYVFRRIQCSQILQRLGEVMIMGDSEDQSVLAKYLNIMLAVVEVRNGESQEEAWRRHLSDHPESASVRIKIFNYHNSCPRKP
jgi:hypothetical protein